MGNLSNDIQSSFKNQKLKGLVNILYTASWITNQQITYFKNFGISPQQYNILRILNGANTPLKVQTIKERMIDKSPNATRLMDKLSEKKLIERLPSDTDRRVIYIEITDQGKKIIADIADDFNLSLIEHISEEEAEDLNRLLDKIR